MNQRGVAAAGRCCSAAPRSPARTSSRTSAIFEGEVRYARDAFEGLRLMDAVMAVKRGEPGPSLAGARAAERRAARYRPARTAPADMPLGPTSPWTTRCRRRRSGAAGWSRASRSADYAGLPGRAGHVPRASGGCAARARRRAGYEELVETEGRPRLRMWLDRLQTDKLLEAAVVYGYFPCVSKGERPDRAARRRHRADPVHLPAPAPGPAPVPGRLLPAEGVRRAGRGRVPLVTVGSAVSAATAELFARNAYRDYLEVHGLSVQLTEALAEYWHAGCATSSASERGQRDLDEVSPAGLPRVPVLVRLPGLPGSGGPRQDRGAADAGADRRDPVRGAAVAPGAVHRRADRAPPRVEVGGPPPLYEVCGNGGSVERKGVGE